MLLNEHKTVFQMWLIRSGLKQGSIDRHLSSLRTLLRKSNILTKSVVDELFLELKNKGSKNNYLYTIINTVRVYTRFLQENNMIYDEECLHYKYLKRNSSVRSTLTDDEIDRFLKLPPPTRTFYGKHSGDMYTSTIDPKGYNVWTLFFTIMAFTGMRPGEVAHLTGNTVDFGRSLFIVGDTKTGQPRYVPIPPNLTEQLKERIAKLKGIYLFPSTRKGTHKGPVVDNVDWHYNFHTRIKRLGIKREGVLPYSLRHSFITSMLESDVNIFKIQKIVGHSDVKMTKIYEHLTTKDIQSAIRMLPLLRKGVEPEEVLKTIKETIKEILEGFKFDNRFEYELSESEKEIKFSLKIKNDKQSP